MHALIRNENSGTVHLSVPPEEIDTREQSWPYVACGLSDHHWRMDFVGITGEVEQITCERCLSAALSRGYFTSDAEWSVAAVRPEKEEPEPHPTLF